MTDIFRDVDEALKQDKILGFWQENGRFIIGCALGVVLVTAAVNIYRGWDKGRDEANSALIINALQEGGDTAANLEGISKELRAGHNGIALLLAAGNKAEEGSDEEALRLYAKTAGTKSIPAELRQYATLMQTRLMLAGTGKNDTVTAAEIADMLEPMVSEPSSAWHWHAMLQTAMAYAQIDGDFEKAAGLAGAVAESDIAPPTLRSRAGALSSVYKIKSNKNKKAGE